MDPELEDQGNIENITAWSGSDSSQEACVSGWRPKSCSTDETTEEFSMDSQPAHISMSGNEPKECWESEQHLSGNEEDVSYRKQEDDMSEPSSPNQTSLSLHQHHVPEFTTTPMTLPYSLSLSSCSSLGSAPEVTLALTLTGEEELQGASNRQSTGTGSTRVESSEEGGSSDAPPACVSFGISEEGAEQAQRWDSGSDTDLYRPDRHRTRYTRLSQSERHVKETKSKCKRIALLLTDAPNPHNKGALLFKKRRQRVKNYTFVSYGTGENIDSEDQIEEEAEELTGYDFVATSDSELEEECCVYHQQCQYSVNWKSLQKMEGLPETQGKGALMFAQRRKRMDEIVSEHEELRSKGLPVEGVTESEHTEAQNIYDTSETFTYNDQANVTDSKQQVDYQENVPKPLVPNRTAKPFLGFQVNAPPPVKHSVVVPVTPVKKKPESKFKVPVPVPSNTSPHVWSPTADIIASRDERISVPAIRTGILPESKRKSTNKQSPPEQKATHLQNKGERRSFIECEEDFFSLGAEACNFMQPKPIKLKNPPPVAPKPTINPACPPWMVRGALDEPYVPPRSQISQPAPGAVGLHSQHYLQPHDRAKPQQMSNHWAQDQTAATLQTSTSMSSQLHPQPTANSWSLQQSRSPVSMQARSPTYSPQPPPSPSRNKLNTASAPNSVASCPPQTEKTSVGSCRGQAGTLAGKGAELFAKRQSRMEKFVVDAESVQVNKPRAPSPTSSLPNSWRYSSNIRAPPPLSYNPLLAPFYPPAAAKQPPSTSPKIKPKQTKQKPKAATKHLNALDIMKHQPYQLNSSLFKYEAVTEIKTPSPKPSPTPKAELKKGLKHKSAPSRSPRNVFEHETTAKSSGLVSSPVPPPHKSTMSTDALAVDKHLDEKLTVSPVLNHISSKQVPSNRPASTSSQHSSISSISDSLAAAFSPASLIARGVRQMAPRPKFSAKKQVFGRSRSLILPRQRSVVSSPALLSPVSAPGSHASSVPRRQTSFQEKPHKPPTPWEAASRSSIGSVDEAFMFPRGPSSIVSSVKAAGHRKSLPEPPEEWKRRVALDPAPVTRGHYQVAPAFQAPSVSRTFLPEKGAFCGPPFRPAQHFRVSTGCLGGVTYPTQYSYRIVNRNPYF